MDIWGWLHAYILVGLIIWLVICLINGTLPKAIELIAFSLLWPAFLVWGVYRFLKRTK